MGLTRKGVWLAGALAVMVTASSCSLRGDDDDNGSAVGADFVVELVRLGSDETAGTVGLSAVPDGKSRIEVVLRRPASGRRVEIIGGNCDVLGGGAAYGLPQLVDGRSQRVIDVPVLDLRQSGYVVLVHDAEGPGGVCADLARSQPPDAAPTYE